MPQEYDTVRYEDDGAGIATVTLDRPDRRNAINRRMIEELGDVFARLAHDLRQRVVILHGAGRGFCSGIDLKAGIDDWPEPLGTVQRRIRFQERFAGLAVQIRELPQPTIAAVHGAAAGGGMSLAAACDIRVVDPTARFNAAFIRIGLSGGDAGASWLLPRLVGLSRAAELLYTGRFFDAREALDIGFASTQAAEGQHVDVATEVAGQILANAPLGVRMTKALLAQTVDAPSLRSHIELENRTQILCTLTEDFEEGGRAFLERRAAQFRDR